MRESMNKIEQEMIYILQECKKDGCELCRAIRSPGSAVLSRWSWARCIPFPTEEIALSYVYISYSLKVQLLVLVLLLSLL
jgi:hypothetical protein